MCQSLPWLITHISYFFCCISWLQEYLWLLRWAGSNQFPMSSPWFLRQQRGPRVGWTLVAAHSFSQRIRWTGEDSNNMMLVMFLNCICVPFRLDAFGECELYGGHLAQISSMSINYCLLNYGHAQVTRRLQNHNYKLCSPGDPCGPLLAQRKWHPVRGCDLFAKMHVLSVQEFMFKQTVRWFCGPPSGTTATPKAAPTTTAFWSA